MSKNEFDELLLKKLQEEELEYKPEHWDHLSQLLPPALVPAAGKGRKWVIATGIAAATAFVLATVFYVKLMDKNKDAFPVREPAVAQKQPEPVKTPETTPQVNPPSVQAPQGQAPLPQQGKQGLAATGNSSANSNRQQQSPMPVMQEKHLPAAAEKTTQTAPAENIATQAPKEQVVPQSPEPNPKEPKSYARNETDRSSYPVYPNGFDNPQQAYANSGAKANKTSVSLGGGVNYGNLNTGYTVGVSARTKIAGNFFVDGAVAMMYNNNTNNVVNYNGANTASKGFAARPSGQLPASPAVEPTQSLYYVQVNPSIGYQVDKNLALSVGSDFQQMLSRTDGAEKVQLAADNNKIFPAFDVGLTTKSEFNITPNIQAGLMYREGLSNLLKNDGNKYVNRRYFQVQFKYNIPVN